MAECAFHGSGESCPDLLCVLDDGCEDALRPEISFNLIGLVVVGVELDLVWSLLCPRHEVVVVCAKIDTDYQTSGN